MAHDSHQELLEPSEIVRQVNSKHSKCLLWVWGVGFLFQSACSFPAVTSTFQTMSSEIESPIEACPNISGTYEFVGTPLAGMPSTFRGMPVEVAKFTFAHLLWLAKVPKTLLDLLDTDTVREVEIIQDQTIQIHFKGPSGRETVVLPESSEDQIQIGCSKGKIIQVRTQEGYGESVTGTSVIKNTYSKSADGSLDITVERVAYLRSLFFFWKTEELYGARFASR